MHKSGGEWLQGLGGMRGAAFGEDKRGTSEEEANKPHNQGPARGESVAPRSFEGCPKNETGNALIHCSVDTGSVTKRGGCVKSFAILICRKDLEKPLKRLWISGDCDTPGESTPAFTSISEGLGRRGEVVALALRVPCAASSGATALPKSLTSFKFVPAAGRGRIPSRRRRDEECYPHSGLKPRC